jgi:hypothetical protein
MECRLAGETEVLGENLVPALLLSITKPHMTRPGFEIVRFTVEVSYSEGWNQFNSSTPTKLKN